MPHFDAEIAGQLLDSAGARTLPALAAQTLGAKLRSWEELAGRGAKAKRAADLPLEEMNMNSLISLVSSELRLNHGYIKYLRKLPDTKLRRDIDVARLNNYQEIEVVLLNN